MYYLCLVNHKSNLVHLSRPEKLKKKSEIIRKKSNASSENLPLRMPMPLYNMYVSTIYLRKLKFIGNIDFYSSVFKHSIVWCGTALGLKIANSSGLRLSLENQSRLLSCLMISPPFSSFETWIPSTTFQVNFRKYIQIWKFGSNIKNIGSSWGDPESFKHENLQRKKSRRWLLAKSGSTWQFSTSSTVYDM